MNIEHSALYFTKCLCRADRPVCFLDEDPTDVKVSSASHRGVTEVLLPLVPYLAVLSNVDYICN